MAFKTFAPGVLTSSDVNTFLMRQAVMPAALSELNRNALGFLVTRRNIVGK
jgi:hypothetical protein